ncbi:MAG TPA: CPXCG motif-containing cysteine-rich protein [Gammaproteobacteria bacterium]
MNYLQPDDYRDLGFMPITDSAEIVCPYCGEILSINIELTLAQQTYTEDCQVCCKPIIFNIEIDYATEQVHIHAQQENE